MAAIMSNKRKQKKCGAMAKNGLENGSKKWVDIGNNDLGCSFAKYKSLPFKTKNDW